MNNSNLEILYISSLSSKRLISDIHLKLKCDPGFAVQKFNRLIVEGLIQNNISVTVLSSPPIKSGYISKLFVKFRSEKEEGITYNYSPIINLKFIKHFISILYTFFYTIDWNRNQSKNKTKVIICDTLNVGITLGGIAAAKLFKILSVGVVTDAYGLMVHTDTDFYNRITKKISTQIHKRYITLFDKYVLLTNHLNSLVNEKGKPYIVMEGLCDHKLRNYYSNVAKTSPRTLMYAGGLYEKYGVQMLVEAFIKSNVNARLVLYGTGSYLSKLMEICKVHKNVVYGGLLSNSEILVEEARAVLLVNPRFSNEEFALYSFPSKNIEYMVSGTPLLTTKLPGMPDEYHPYVYLFDQETVEDYALSIKKILNLPDSELNKMGQEARDFIISQKNNIVQVKKIVELISAL